MKREAEAGNANIMYKTTDTRLQAFEQEFDNRNFSIAKERSSE